MKLLGRSLVVGLVAPLTLWTAACRQDMHDQPRYEPLEASSFFPDGRASRPQVPGTLARGDLDRDPQLETGLVDGEPARSFPFEVTADVLGRGRERYDIFCSVCHDAAGYGEGMVVKRGFKRPESFHVERLREAPPGYFVDAMTRGFGAMFDVADRVPPGDRWAIAAYIKTLQLSQDAALADVPLEERARLEEQM